MILQLIKHSIVLLFQCNARGHVSKYVCVFVYVYVCVCVCVCVCVYWICALHFELQLYLT
jgi:hypothetical protein